MRVGAHRRAPVIGRMPGMRVALGLVLLLSSGVSAGDARTARGATPVAPAAGVLLVARRDLPDPNFHRAVVFLTAHGAGGSVGVIVNRRTRLRLVDAVPDLPGVEKTTHTLFFGGPVAATQVVMLMRNEQPGAEIAPVVDGVYLSADRDVLAALIARNKPARDLRLYVGHAGWAPGQLQQELARRDWYVIKADAGWLFADDVDTLWERLIDKLDPAALFVRAPAAVTAART
jgi:putative transcriptional regulator